MSKTEIVENVVMNVEDREIKLIHQRLLAPFSWDDTEVRPGMVNKDKTKATALFYVDPRAITQRLDKVFGLGGYSIITPEPQAHLDFKKAYNATEYNQGLLVSCTCTIQIHHPYLTKSVSNVGEKGLDETGHNKTTSAWAQAYKRAASLLGVGSYFYFMKNVGWFPYDEKSKKVDVSSLKDEHLVDALTDVGFEFKCEISGAQVPWKVAAASMQRFGKILSVEEGRKLKEAQGL